MNGSGKKLIVVDDINPKNIIIAGLKKKIEELGSLRQSFDVTKDYPSRETFEQDLDDGLVVKRRIVVSRPESSVEKYAIGHEIESRFLAEKEIDGTIQDVHLVGWVDKHTIEVSVWTPDSNDRDNILVLLNMWMLELEQDIQNGNLEVPYFYENQIFAITYLREYEEKNYDLLTGGGPIYIGTAVYQVISPFFHLVYGTEYQQYKMNLIAKITDCIHNELSINLSDMTGKKQPQEVTDIEEEIRTRQ